MFNFFSSNLKKGIKKIAGNPQLFLTIVIAVLITGAFVFMAERFISIATRAEERLVNVRVGSLQDAFVSFAREKMNEPAYLNERINDVVETNETIRSFRVIVRTRIQVEAGALPSEYLIVASNNPEEVGKGDAGADFLYNLASVDPSSSLTVSINEEGERLFQTARAITDSAGEVLGVAMTTQTLSQADLAIKESIRNSRILLFAVVILILALFFRHSRIIDYMALYKKLKEVDQLKDDFVSMASHELRTPLSIIRGYAEFIREAPELSIQTKEHVSKIDIATKELDFLVADILDVSRIEQGRMSFKTEKMNSAALVEEVVNSLAIPAKEKGLALSFDKSKVSDTQYINADRDRLRQVLVNLAGNAVKYTEKGEVTLRQYVEDGRVYIRVDDTGIGMSEEERARLFEKFYRVRTKETEKIRGTGLGLWITAQIVKQMNGKISVESIKGVGSRFIISFPLVS